MIGVTKIENGIDKNALTMIVRDELAKKELEKLRKFPKVTKILRDVRLKEGGVGKKIEIKRDKELNVV